MAEPLRLPSFTPDHIRRATFVAPPRTAAPEAASPRGGRTNAPSSGAPGGRQRDVHLDVPWISQYDAKNVERAGPVACYRTCRAMAARVGVHVPDGTEGRIQVATGEDARGRVITTSDRTARARQYIDKELDRGRPVTMGISFMDANYNRDGITDHFVLVTGRGTDAKGRTYYTTNDPAAPNRQVGQSLRYYVEPKTGNLYRPDPNFAQMSMVVPSR